MKKLIFLFFLAIISQIVFAQQDSLNRALFDAVKANNLERVKELIKNGADVMASNEYGYTPLHKACMNKSNFEIAKLLIEKGADVNAKLSENNNDYTGYSTLHFAVKENNFKLTKLLVENGADVNAIVSKKAKWNHYKGFSPLHVACWNENGFEIVKLLVAKGADVNARVSENNKWDYKPGYNSLHFACDNENGFEIAKLLIDNGADVNTKNKNLQTPLHFSCDIENGFEIAKLLIKNGADLNAKDDDKYTALHYTNELKSDKYKQRNIESLLINGIDVSINFEELIEDIDFISLKLIHYYRPSIFEKTYNNITALELAQNNSNNQIASYVSKPDNRFFLMLEFEEFNEFFKEIKSKKYDLNQKNSGGNTLLHEAILNNQQGIVKLLIKKGANINEQNNFGQTPLFYSILLGNSNISSMLIKQNADFNILDDAGRSALYIAEKVRNESIAKHLKSLKAIQTSSFKPKMIVPVKNYLHTFALSFSEDNKYLAVGSKGGFHSAGKPSITVFDTKDFRIVKKIKIPAPGEIKFSNNNTLLFVTNKHKVDIFDFETGNTIKQIYYADAVSNSGKQMLKETPDEFIIIETLSNKQLSKSKKESLNEYFITFSFDGNSIITSDTIKAYVRKINFKSNRQKAYKNIRFKNNNYSHIKFIDKIFSNKDSSYIEPVVIKPALNFSSISNNKRFHATASVLDNNLRVYDKHSKEMINLSDNNILPTRAIAYNNKTNCVLIGDGNIFLEKSKISSLNFSGSLKIDTLMNLNRTEGPPKFDIQYSENKKYILLLKENLLKIFESDFSKKIVMLSDINYAEFTNNKEIIYLKNDTVFFYDLEKQKILNKIDDVEYFRYLKEKNRLYTLSLKKNKIKEIDLNKGLVLNQSDFEKSYDFNTSYRGSYNYNIFNNISNSGSVLLGGFNRDIVIKSFNNKTVKILDKAIFSPTRTFFYSDYEKIISYDFKNPYIRLYNPKNAYRKTIFSGHTAGITDVIFAENSSLMLSSSYDYTIKIWDIETSKELATLVQTDSLNWVITTQNGLFDASPGAMDKMHYVVGLEIIELNQLKDRYYEPGLLKKIMKGEKLRDVHGFNDIKLPPHIKLSPIENGNLKINIKNNYNGGIGRVKVLANGKEIIEDARLLTGKGPAGFKNPQGLVINIDLNKYSQYFIPGKDNMISVQAYNGEEYILSHPQFINYIPVVPKGYNPDEIPDVYIVCIGVSDYYGYAIDLRFAAKDAEDMMTALKTSAEGLFGVNKVHSFLLTSPLSIRTDVTQIALPTKGNIETRFLNLSKKIDANDILIVYLAGHGINIAPDGKDGDFYYLTSDAYSGDMSAYFDEAIRNKTTVKSSEFVKMLTKQPANKQVLIIDACHSGKAVESLSAQRDMLSSTIRAFDRMRDRTGMHIITGSTADAVSYESNRFGQGILTYSLLEGIKGTALREGQFVDVIKLFQKSKERVPVLAEGLGGIQEPVIFSPYLSGKFEKGAESFDIGKLTKEEKAKIPLAKSKPIFVMTILQDADAYDDNLYLGEKTDEELRELTAKGVKAPLILIETRDFPGAYKIRGQYTSSGDKVNLKVKMFEDKTVIKTIDLSGDKNNIDSLIQKLINETLKAIKK